jgi:hypothetical protein
MEGTQRDSSRFASPSPTVLKPVKAGMTMAIAVAVARSLRRIFILEGNTIGLTVGR